jgi:2,4-dienoyl-CoA reductase-like NADH-dependent reductase (Old Yellow Enzyme family)
MSNAPHGCEKFEPFHYKSIQDLKLTIKRLKIFLPIDDKFECFKQSTNLDNRDIPNRLSVQPMEGFDSQLDGSPSILTLRRYKRYAMGGAGIIWIESTSILKEFKSNPHQLVITEKNSEKFKKFVRCIRNILNDTLKNQGFENRGIIILQLNHSGRYSKKGKKKYPIRAYHHNDLDEAININKKDGEIISDEELSKLEDIWVRKAELAYEAGFDGVDIKSCHGYLISELLGARTRENSIYGGYALENRARLLLNVINRLNSRISASDFISTTRLGLYDGLPYPYGFGNAKIKNDDFPATIDLSEPIKLIKLLYRQGVKLLNISSGNPHYKPFLTRPYDIPPAGSENPPEHPLCSVSRMINLASSIKKKIPDDMIIIGSGYSYLRQFAINICSALINKGEVDICGFGRMSFANPNFPKQIFQNQKIDKDKVCITCSKCSELMSKGKSTGCTARDPLYNS